MSQSNDQELQPQPLLPPPSEILVGAGLAFLAGLASTLGSKFGEELWERAKKHLAVE